MATHIPIPPRTPKDCPAWLYETLSRLRRSVIEQDLANAAIDRGETPNSTGNPLPVIQTQLALPFIYITLTQHLTNPNLIQQSLDSLAAGGVVQLGPGIYHLVAPLVLRLPAVKLKGAGSAATVLVYDANPNLDIVTMKNAFVELEDLSIWGTTAPDNGAGQTGTGRGIYIAGVGLTFLNTPQVRRVQVLCTPSWAIYADGAGTYNITTGSFDPTGNGPVVAMVLQDLTLGYWNSGGAIFSGAGNVIANLNNVLTVGYSFGTYQPHVQAIPPTEGLSDIGHIHLDTVQDYRLTNLVMQMAPAQSGSPAIPHADTDATFLSMIGGVRINVENMYWEGLSATAPRTHWCVTSINTQYKISGVFGFFHKLNEPARIYKEAASGFIGNIGVWEDVVVIVHATAHQQGPLFGNCTTVSGNNVVNVAPTSTATVTVGQSVRGSGTHGSDIPLNCTVTAKTATTLTLSKVAAGSHSDVTLILGPAPPNVPGDVVTLPTDDFVIAGALSGFANDSEGHVHSPFVIRNCLIGNDLGNYRPPTTPKGAVDGETVVNRPLFQIEGNGWMRLPKYGSMGTGNIDAGDARVNLNHDFLGGVGTMLYVNDNEHADQNQNGIWVCDRGNNFRQVAYIRIAAGAYSTPALGELWYDTSTNFMRFYDGSAWQTYIKRSLGTAAGDLIYYTGSDTPARLPKGTNGQVLTLATGLPAWIDPTHTFDEVDCRKLVATGTIDDIEIVAQAKAGQSSNIQEWWDSSFNVLADISPAGYVDAVGYRTPAQNGPLLANNIATKKVQTDLDLLTTATTKTVKFLNMSGSPVLVSNAPADAATGEIARYFNSDAVADISSKKLLNGGATTNGLYEVALYLKTKTAGTAGSQIKVTLAWNDGTSRTMDVSLQGSQAAGTLYTQHDLTSTNNFSWANVVLMAAASTNITFAATGTYNTSPHYELYVVIKHLGPNA